MYNKENMLKWADALESGEFRQNQGGWGCGESQNAYCCLHVAYRVFEGEDIDWDKLNKIDDAFTITKSLGKHLGDSITVAEFATYNDVENMSFPEIAKIIREKVQA